MEFVQPFSTLNSIIDFVLSIVLLIVIIFLSIKFKFNKFSIVLLGTLSGVLIITNLFSLVIASYFLFVLEIGLVFVLSLTHTGAIRTFFSKIAQPKSIIKKTTPDRIIDHEALYNEIYETVAACSHQKIGALITFEKHDSLKNLTKNGTVINAPVSHELLMTIFYPGTRLHDGAVIIKDNMVYAASVYYTPTTKALTGKYGSRHRAAIGISEMSDSVTVVVSEETGRISIAQYGEIEPVALDDFIRVLDEKMTAGE